MSDGLFDQSIKVMATWDWVTPVWSWVQDWHYRPSTGFFMPYDCGRSAWEIVRFLKSKGVRVWGALVIGDEISIRVREAQSDYTAMWLGRMGVPYTGGLSMRKRKATKRRAKRKPRSR